MSAPLISVSVVSHGQGPLVQALLRDLERHCSAERIEVVVTLNKPEKLEMDFSKLPFPVNIIENGRPKGFSANHNAAFAAAAGNCFCVVNPDIRLESNPFPVLLSRLDAKAGVVAPKVVSPQGNLEDSARTLPTPIKLLKKLFGGNDPSDYGDVTRTIYPDWVAGMFMLFPASVYREMGGFDEHYFLYYEDVDLCCRLRLRGYKVVYEPAATVIHDARRDSHRRFSYMRRHIASILRFFFSPVFIRSLLKGGAH